MENIIYSNFKFEFVNKDKYHSLLYNKELKLAICAAEEEYIPISNFKNIFLAISNLIEHSQVHNLIFDKRNLRTFHQPSMEWYFALWKPTVREKGLINHYKILPDLDWFLKSVEAGKHEIFKKYGKNIIVGINILYVKNIEIAIENIQKNLITA